MVDAADVGIGTHWNTYLSRLSPDRSLAMMLCKEGGNHTATPLWGICEVEQAMGPFMLCHYISLISTLVIPKLYSIVHHMIIYIYIHINLNNFIYLDINVAVSCKRYPASLPYVITVQTFGKG